MFPPILQRELFDEIFALSHLGDLHFGQTVGGSFVARPRAKAIRDRIGIANRRA
jgi:hypothetical protein